MEWGVVRDIKTKTKVMLFWESLIQTTWYLNRIKMPEITVKKLQLQTCLLLIKAYAKRNVERHLGHNRYCCSWGGGGEFVLFQVTTVQT